jgi:pimeloyl-ACP methyl ester carboxylesterase
MTSQIRHRSATVNGLKVYSCEAGDPTSPTILLLHGLPTSSQMFRGLIPALALATLFGHRGKKPTDAAMTEASWVDSKAA